MSGWLFHKSSNKQNILTIFAFGFLTPVFFCIQSADINLFCQNKPTLKRGKKLFREEINLFIWQEYQMLSLETGVGIENTLLKLYPLSGQNMIFHHSDCFVGRFYYAQYNQH